MRSWSGTLHVYQIRVLVMEREPRAREKEINCIWELDAPVPNRERIYLI
jgi:hypothetical protein